MDIHYDAEYIVKFLYGVSKEHGKDVAYECLREFASDSGQLKDPLGVLVKVRCRLQAAAMRDQRDQLVREVEQLARDESQLCGA